MTSLFALPEELAIYTVADLREAWLAALSSVSDDGDRREMRVDASRVDQVDAAGVQWLLALHTYLASQKRRLVLERVSQPLRSACEVMGLAHLVPAAADMEHAS